MKIREQGGQGMQGKDTSPCNDFGGGTPFALEVGQKPGGQKLETEENNQRKKRRRTALNLEKGKNPRNLSEGGEGDLLKRKKVPSKKRR